MSTLLACDRCGSARNVVPTGAPLASVSLTIPVTDPLDKQATAPSPLLSTLGLTVFADRDLCPVCRAGTLTNFLATLDVDAGDAQVLCDSAVAEIAKKKP